MKNILFIYTHLDDETILSYGTMCKFAADNNKINILILCGQGRNTGISANVEKQQQRIEAFARNCKDFNYKLCQHKDITLTADVIKEDINTCINNVSPDMVFSHSMSDLHYEHRMVAEEVLVACRRHRRLTVKELYAAVSPAGIMQAFNLKNTFTPNYFVDISDYIAQKKQALALYSMELPADNNDIRSSESIVAQNKQYGRLMNTGYCEAYQQIFKLT